MPEASATRTMSNGFSVVRIYGRKRARNAQLVAQAGMRVFAFLCV